MNRKTPKCYSAVFQYVERKLFKLEPSFIITDYEDGLRKAIREYWPNVDLRGCWWHHKRAVQKKCASFGLVKIFNKNAEARRIKRMLTNISLLPNELILEGFESVKEYARKKKLFETFQATFTYYETYWLQQVCISFKAMFY